MYLISIIKFLLIEYSRFTYHNKYLLYNSKLYNFIHKIKSDNLKPLGIIINIFMNNLFFVETTNKSCVSKGKLQIIFIKKKEYIFNFPKFAKTLLCNYTFYFLIYFEYHLKSLYHGFLFTLQFFTYHTNLTNKVKKNSMNTTKISFFNYY